MQVACDRCRSLPIAAGMRGQAMEAGKWLILLEFVRPALSADKCPSAASLLCTAQVRFAALAFYLLSSGCLMLSPHHAPPPVIDLIELAHDAIAALDALLADAAARCANGLWSRATRSARLFDREQRATHGLAWLATYVEAVRQLTAYAERMTRDGTFGEIEELIVRIGLGEYLAQIVGGIPDEPGRDRAAERSRSVGAAGCRAVCRVGGAPDCRAATRRAPRPAGRIDACEPQRDGRASAASMKRWNRSARRCASLPTAK